MSVAADAAISRAREMPLQPATPLSLVARELHDAAVAGVSAAAAAGLRRIDSDFDARVAASTTEEPHASKKRLVTPIPDIVAAFAGGSILAAGWGAGRLTSPGSWIESAPVVGWTVVVSAAVALAAVALGVIFARREAAALRAQRVQSDAVARAAMLYLTAVLSAIGVPGIIVRMTDEPTALLVVGLVLTVILVVTALPLAVLAQRESRRGASQGRMLPRRGGSAQTRRRFALEDAAAQAQDDASARLTELSEKAQDEISAAYAKAAQVVAMRGALAADTRRALTRTDPTAARYAR